MARYARLLFSGNFAVGAARYRDFYPNEEQSARIVLSVIVEGRFTTPVIVDTGAPWCILDPEIAEAVMGEQLARYEPDTKILVRGVSYEGTLQRMRLVVQNEFNESDLEKANLEVEATVFVPMLPPDETWPHPNFIGLDGFLNRVRVAIDPGENIFYFGPT